ncbi:hypothetical protein D3C81_769410 [compost metagenome]
MEIDNEARLYKLTRPAVFIEITGQNHQPEPQIPPVRGRDAALQPHAMASVQRLAMQSEPHHQGLAMIARQLQQPQNLPEWVVQHLLQLREFFDQGSPQL